MAAKRRRPQLRVGDKVRLNTKHRVFEKGYTPGWTEEVFRVKSVRAGPVPTYKVTEWEGTPIRGTFYEEDLQRVSAAGDDVFRVERVIRKKGNRALVRWKGWLAKYDSWVLNKDIVSLGPQKKKKRRRRT